MNSTKQNLKKKTKQNELQSRPGTFAILVVKSLKWNESNGLS